MKKKKIWIAVGIAVVVVGIGGFAIVQSGKNGMGSATAAITATEIAGGAKVTKGDLSSNVYISGTVEANDKRSVSYMGGGLVSTVYVKEGDRVSADQTLVKINSDKLDSELKKMMNELSISKAEINKMKTRGIGDQEAALDRRILRSPGHGEVHGRSDPLQRRRSGLFHHRRHAARL